MKKAKPTPSMKEKASTKQDELKDNQNPLAESKPETPKTYNAEQERLIHLFFKAIEPYELKWYQDRNTELPTDLDERFFHAFECYPESFILFLDKLEYFEKLEVYPYLLGILPKKINDLAGNQIGEGIRDMYKRYFHGFRNEFRQLKVDSKFHLTWDKHNLYLLPLLIETLCDIGVIPEPKKTALSAFQFIFPKTKLGTVSSRAAIDGAFKNTTTKAFNTAINRFLKEIKDCIDNRHLEFRKVNLKEKEQELPL